MYKELKSLFNVSGELTTKCNNRCIHYYNDWIKYFRDDILFCVTMYLLSQT
jgi:MoaA/NifB/PqqE/SkfB family radical SAM enzyme